MEQGFGKLIWILLASYGTRGHKIPSMDHILNQRTNPVHNLTPYFLNIQFKIILISTPTSSIGLFFQRLRIRFYSISYRKHPSYTSFLLGYEVLPAVVMKSSVFWDITLCNLLKIISRFGGTFCIHLQSLLPAPFLFLAGLILQLWRWRRHVSPKRPMVLNGIHSIISRKTKGKLPSPLGNFMVRKDVIKTCKSYTIYRYAILHSVR
jgi:hypothetical protein